MEAQSNKIVSPESIEELLALVRNSPSITTYGRENLSLTLSSAEGLGPPNTETNTTLISLAAFNQIVEYQPEEYTITVQAGISVKEVQSALAEKGQYLPFDPPFSGTDMTIGSMIEQGLSGPGSFRYGILRDFILGVNFVDGLGGLIHTGGKVVKNAAGFDIPKLMSGSGGSFGIITEATFKVFPISPERRTVVFSFPSFEAGYRALVSLGRSRFTLDVLDLDPQGRLYIELGGQPGSMDQRVAALESHLSHNSETLTDIQISEFWDPKVRLEVPPQSGILVKIPVNPSIINTLETALKPHHAVCRYSIGGYVSWIHWEDNPETLSTLLEDLNLSGQVTYGETQTRLIGRDTQRSFYNRLKAAFDPHGKFVDLYTNLSQPALDA